MINHSAQDCQVPKGDRIAQKIIEKIDMSEVMEVDKLGITDRGTKGFGSTDLSPKRTIGIEQVQPVMCQLHANRKENQLFAEEDIGHHPWL